MKDNSSEKPKKSYFEEGRIFSCQDSGDSPRAEKEYSKGDETQTDVYTSPQIFGSLRRQRQSRRSQRLLVLLCIGLGVIVLGIFFLMKPEVKQPQIADQQMTRPISPEPEEEETTISGALEKTTKEPEPSEDRIGERENPGVSIPTEVPVMSRGTGGEIDVGIVGETEALKGERGDRATEVAQDTGEAEPQVAESTQPKSQATPEQPSLTGGFTVNVASFKERVRADTFVNELNEKGYEAFVSETTISESGTFYRVSIGRFPSREEAEALAQELREKDGMDSFVRELGKEKG